MIGKEVRSQAVLMGHAGSLVSWAVLMGHAGSLVSWMVFTFLSLFRHDYSVAKPVTSVLVIVFIEPKDIITSRQGLGQLECMYTCYPVSPALFSSFSSCLSVVYLQSGPRTFYSAKYHVLTHPSYDWFLPHEHKSWSCIFLSVLFFPVCSVPLKQSTFAHWLPLAFTFSTRYVT